MFRGDEGHANRSAMLIYELPTIRTTSKCLHCMPLRFIEFSHDGRKQEAVAYDRKRARRPEFLGQIAQALNCLPTTIITASIYLPESSIFWPENIILPAFFFGQDSFFHHRKRVAQLIQEPESLSQLKRPIDTVTDSRCKAHVWPSVLPTPSSDIRGMVLLSIDRTP